MDSHVSLLQGPGWVKRVDNLVVWSEGPAHGLWAALDRTHLISELINAYELEGAADTPASTFALVDLFTGEFAVQGGAHLLADDVTITDTNEAEIAGVLDEGAMVTAGHADRGEAWSDSDLQAGTVQAGGFTARVRSDSAASLVAEVTIGHPNTGEFSNPLLALPSPVRAPGEPANPRSRRSPFKNRRPEFSVVFDDGQAVVATHGIIVGRNPEKHGLPPGYISATITSEHVSRVHWQLRINRGNLLLTDSGSAEGTHLRFPDGRLRVVPLGEEVTVPRGSQVFFADRWAQIK